MNKVLVKLYIPMMELEYDAWFPLNKKVYKVINLVVKAINELSGGYYNPSYMPLLYDKLTAKKYDINLSVKKANIRNGAEIVLI